MHTSKTMLTLVIQVELARVRMTKEQYRLLIMEQDLGLMVINQVRIHIHANNNSNYNLTIGFPK